MNYNITSRNMKKRKETRLQELILKMLKSTTNTWKNKKSYMNKQKEKKALIKFPRIFLIENMVKTLSYNC